MISRKISLKISHDITISFWADPWTDLFRGFTMIYQSMNIHNPSSLAKQYQHPEAMQATRVCQTRDDQRGGLEARLR